MLKLNRDQDSLLIERIQTNDRSVLGELFVQYEKLIKSYVMKHGGSEADADDMLQESVIVLWKNVIAGKFELKAKLSTYVMAVAKNKWMAESRKRQRLSHDIPDDRHVDESGDALHQLEVSERTRQVQRALIKLGSPCKDLIQLYYFEERNMDDIAKLLGFANRNVAKSKKYQCKKSLEKILENMIVLEARRVSE